MLKSKIDEVESLEDEDVEQLCSMIRALHDTSAKNLTDNEITNT